MRGFAYSFYSLTICSCLAAGLAIDAAMFAAPSTAHADSEKRVALVIGNGNHKIAPHLDNPANDARAIAETLRKLGRGRRWLRPRRLPDAEGGVGFLRGVAAGEIGGRLLFRPRRFVDNKDFLLPVDIDWKSPTDLDISAISLPMVLKQMKLEERVNIVLLDACRDNPFVQELARDKTPAAIGPRGLSPIQGELARGTLIAFATDPNSTAQDGVQGEHSPFTEALLNHLPDPSAPIDTVMPRVRSEVWEKTKHIQRPWVYSSLTSEFSFNPRAATAAPTTPEAAVARPPKLGEGELALGIRAAFQSERRLSNLSRRVSQRPVCTDGEEPNCVAGFRANDQAAPEAAPPTGPAGPPEKELKAEIGTYDTEKYLRLEAVDRKEIQARLQVLRYYTGPIDGSFNEQTRQAIAEWQKKRQVAPTGMLGPVEIAALQAESEEMYQAYLKEPPEEPDAQPENPQATPRVLSYTPSVQAPATARHYQSYHYQSYHYRYHHYAYHYRRHRHYYYAMRGPYDGGIFSILNHFGYEFAGLADGKLPRIPDRSRRGSRGSARERKDTERSEAKGGAVPCHPRNLEVPL